MHTLEEQLSLEEYYKNYAREAFRIRIKKEIEGNRGDKTPMAKGIMTYYKETMAENVENFIKAELEPKRGARRSYNELVKTCVEEHGIEHTVMVYCAFCFEACLQALLSDTSFSVSSIAIMMGKRIYYELALDAYTKEIPKGRTKDIERQLDKRVQTRYKEAFIKRAFENEGFTWCDYNTRVLADLGAQLIYIFVSTTNLAEFTSEGRRSEHIVPSALFHKIWSTNLERMAHRCSIDVPTIIPPKPWTSIYDGAYYGALRSNTWFIRLAEYTLKTDYVKDYLERIERKDKLGYIMQAVNKIQDTPYKVNKRLLKVIKTILDMGGGRAGIEQSEPLPEIAPLTGEPDKETLRLHKRKIYERNMQELARRSRALRVYKIYNTAKDFAEYDTIYFPCNIDFRGRIYPMSYLNHQGDDIMKSVLHYADPKPCTMDEDVDLLKVQGCNLYGNDKISLKDRCEWVDKNEKEILASSADPFLCNFWEGADEPLQFLSFCDAYRDALLYKKNNGTLVGYKCPIPIAYDGTCSGLQHYSAMLRDEIGGTAVNLVDHDKPADIYQNVADKVKVLVELDSMCGTDNYTKYYEESDTTVEKRGTKSLADAWLAYGITRKVCKRSVMTLAYGSKQYGFGEQIYTDITKDNPHFKGFEDPASKYLASKIWQSVQDVVVKGAQAMEYLQKIARRVVNSGKPVQWETPLGLDVQQVYLERSQEMFKARLGTSLRLPIYYLKFDEQEELRKTEQVNGIAPNFIHSLDSTHLMMVVNESSLSNYTTIHDSFGTSLGEAYELKEIIRKQFHRLYTEYEPLKDFRKQAEELIGESLEDIEEPTKGELDLAEVLTRTYIFH